MNLKQLINKSVYGTIGYIASQDDINLVEQYILYNLNVLKEYKRVIVATNFKDKSLISKYEEVWGKYLDCTLLTSEINRGHQIGTTDLDNILFEWCKNNKIEWLCKSANDTILQEEIFNIEIEEADFYYTTGIGWAGVRDYNFDYNKIIDELFYPQTNFYFINLNKVDNLLPKEELEQSYNIFEQPNYNGKIQTYIDEFCCERILNRCILRNNLKHYNLIPKNKYLKLLQLIHHQQIHDGSHKNIMINGICHYHFYNQNIYII